MSFNSKTISALLAFLTAAISVFIFAYIRAITQTEIVLIFILSFIASFLIIFLSLEFVFFRQINKLAHKVSRIKKGEIFELKDTVKYIGSLQDMETDFNSFVRHKQDEVEHLQKMAAFRKEFIADVSHELKTPIFAAQGFVHTLLDGAIKDKNVRQRFLKKAAKSLDGLDMLVQDLLSLSRLETGEIKLHYEYVDLIELTTEVFEQFESRAYKKLIKIGFQGPDILKNSHQKYEAYADANLIYQGMTNLVSNAIKYTKEGGKVSVDFRIVGEDIYILVIDNGRGIPPKDIDRIFERFYRVDKSRTREKDKGGTGLGLAIVKHIMEAHNSEIKVESEVSKGSIFKFKLPRNRKRAKIYGYS